MQTKGITAYGAYVPSLRMNRKAIADAHAWAMPSLRGLGKGTRSFCDWDEDAITMAVEAVRGCSDGQQLSSLTFASTTPVFADLQNATMVATAAGLPENISVMDTAGSLRAGTSAVIAALNSASEGESLVVASELRQGKPASVQEMHYGAGSAALTIGSDNVIASCLGSFSIQTQFIDHFRATGEDHDYYWEERWIRDEGYMKVVPKTVAGLFEKTDATADDINYFCMPGTLSRLAPSIAKKLGISGDAVVDNFAATIGDTGSPQPLLMLLSALEQAKPGEKILVIGFGAGCDAILFQATDAITSYKSKAPVSAAIENGKEVNHYNQLLSFSGQLQLDWGMRAEVDNKSALTQLYRAQDQVAAFTGGECPDCGAIQFPVLATCVKCGSVAKKAPRRLADEPAKVATYTSDFLQYYPAPPMYWGLVQFDNGARVLMEMVDVDPAQMDVGSPLRMVYRIKQKDSKRKLDRYFWKATPQR